MRGYILRRLLVTPAILLGVLTLTFLLVHITPGEPFSADRATGLDPQAAARLRAVFGTDAPLPVRYARWLGAAVTGDLGVSFTYRRPVAGLLGEALAPTLLLSGSSLLLALAAGVAAACATTIMRGRWAARTMTVLGMAVYAAPTFWLGMLLVIGFALHLGWFPPSGIRSVDAEGLSWAATLLDRSRHLALPCLTLALPAGAAIALHLRAALADLLGSPFGTAAQARGASRPRVVLVHMLRHAAGSTVSLIGLALPGLVGGGVVVEVLFAWPGMGRITYEAILARDLPVVTGAVALAALVTLAGSLLADVLYTVLDPRTRPAGAGLGGAFP